MLEATPATQLLAVDIGGTKVAAALVSGDGAIVTQLQEPTNQEGPRQAMAQIARLLRQTMRVGDVGGEEILGLGVGIPAVLDDEDHVIWGPNLQGWRDVALRHTLQAELGVPVVVEYDGHAAVLGEWWAGAGRGYHTVANVIIGTGIGGGLIVEGRLLRGRNRLAGAVGWFALSADRGEGPAEHEVSWEALAAGPGIVRRARAALGAEPRSALAGVDELEARHVFDAARRGDGLASRIVQETAHLIGLGAANIVSLVNPQIVILGGGIGCQGDLLLPQVRAVVARQAQPISASDLPIVSSQLGARAGLLGAAYAALLRLSGKQEEVILNPQ